MTYSHLVLSICTDLLPSTSILNAWLRRIGAKPSVRLCAPCGQIGLSLPALRLHFVLPSSWQTSSWPSNRAGSVNAKARRVIEPPSCNVRSGTSLNDAGMHPLAYMRRVERQDVVQRRRTENCYFGSRATVSIFMRSRTGSAETATQVRAGLFGANAFS